MASAVCVLVVAVDRTAARAQAAYVNRLPGFRTAATVGSAAAGLRRLGKGDVDLILLDRMLPDGDGAELAARLREQGFRGDVILTRAADDRFGAEERTTPGVVGELIRPFSFESFRETLSAWSATRPDTARDAARSRRPGPAPRGDRANRRTRAAKSTLPLGMRPDTLHAITVVLQERYQGTRVTAGETAAEAEPGGVTVSSIATAVGASRLTVRRYLEYLADAGVLARSLRERAAGRPEALYRPVVRHG